MWMRTIVIENDHLKNFNTLAIKFYYQLNLKVKDRRIFASTML